MDGANHPLAQLALGFALPLLGHRTFARFTELQRFAERHDCVRMWQDHLPLLVDAIQRCVLTSEDDLKILLALGYVRPVRSSVRMLF